MQMPCMIPQPIDNFVPQTFMHCMIMQPIMQPIMQCMNVYGGLNKDVALYAYDLGEALRRTWVDAGVDL